MKISAIALVAALPSASAFVLQKTGSSQATFLKGYLDDLTSDLYAEDSNPNPDEEDRDANKMDEKDKDRYGVGSWDNYVEFDEFDGGDGQMGVAGDGNKMLAKFDMSSMAKSKTMSAKNAWGTDSGYANKLVSEGVDIQRAQQLENWHNQQEVLNKRKAQRSMIDDFDTNTDADEENWRELAKFGVERTQVRR
jgi:hypothetical protein